ncbi:MAG: hypothetical protein ACI4B6_03740 [Atopobiaceae bacterium]
MSSLTQALGYLSEVTKFASQGPVSYGMGECVCLVRPYTVIAGVLSKADTDRLVDDFCNVHGGSLDGYGRVPVVISLRTLVYDDPRRSAKGLVLLPAMLDINGRLSVDLGTQQPWIPLERLSAPGSAPRAITVGSLADYRHFQIEHQAEFADPVTWGVYVDLAISMFDTICHLDSEGLADSRCRVDTELCRIKCLAMPEPTLTASNVFAHLGQAPMGMGAADTGVLNATMPPVLKPYFAGAPDDDEDSAPTLTLSRLDLEQADAEREAPSAASAASAGKAQGQKGEGVRGTLPAAHDDRALDAPKDPTSLRATDRLMQNAKLRRGSCQATTQLSPDSYDALRDLCAEPREPLSCVQVPLGDEALRLATSLAAQRVTECAVRGEDEPLVVLGVSSGVFRRRVSRALDEALPSEASILYRPWLRRGFVKAELPRVTQEFLDSAQAALGRPHATPEAAAGAIAALLRRIDQLRCELVDGYAEVRTASDLARQQEERLLALARLRDEHARAQARLEYWSHLAEQGRAHRALGRGRGGQRASIEEGAQEGEALALGCQTLDEVVSAYAKLVQQQKDKLASTRRETAKLELRVKRHSLSGTRGAEDVATLVQLCQLDRAKKRQLDSLFSGGQLNAQRLDKVLDQTVRPCEFWLAVHLYEARELASGRVGRMPRWRTVATIYEIPGLVGKLTGQPPIDLLLCLRAERMRTPQALSCLALCRRAVVMGDQAGIGPRWELDPQADHDIARLTMSAAGWDFVRSHDIGASAPQRFLGATVKACSASPRTLYQLSSLAPSTGVLAEFRSKAFYDGRASSAPEPGVSALYVFDDGPSNPERVGNSLRSSAEAQRLVDWLQAHFAQLRRRYGVGDAASDVPFACVVTPYTSHAQLVSNLLCSTDATMARMVQVRTIRQASGEQAPLVIFSGVTSVEQLNHDFTFGVSSLLCVASALAQKALAVFCDDSWRGQGTQSSLAVGQLFLCATPWTDDPTPATPGTSQDEGDADEDADTTDVSGAGDGSDSANGVAATAEAEAADDDQSGADDATVESDQSEDSDGPATTDSTEGATVEDQSEDAPVADTTMAKGYAPVASTDEPQGSAPGTDAEDGQAQVDDQAAGQPSSSSQREDQDAPAGDDTPTDETDDDTDGDASVKEAPSDDETQTYASDNDAVKKDASAEDLEDDGQQAAPRIYATLAQVLHELYVSQRLDFEPEEDTTFRWLQRDGFVMVSSARDGSIGWVPTQRGIRCGMVPCQHDDGSLWCGMSDGAAEYVLASVQLHSRRR